MKEPSWQEKVSWAEDNCPFEIRPARNEAEHDAMVSQAVDAWAEEHTDCAECGEFESIDDIDEHGLCFDCREQPTGDE